MKQKYKLGCLLIIILFALFTLGIQQLTMSYKEIAENGYIMISISSLAVGAIMYKYIMSKISSDLPTNEEEKEELREIVEKWHGNTFGDFAAKLEDDDVKANKKRK